MKKTLLTVALMLTLQDQVHMAQNIYFEARGEGRIGWKMVMATTLCRVQCNAYPDTVYAVIWQNRQFSWTQDGKSDVPTDELLFKEIFDFVQSQDTEELLQYKLTNYHKYTVNPDWPENIRYITQFGKHKFYRDSTIY